MVVDQIQDLQVITCATLLCLMMIQERCTVWNLNRQNQLLYLYQ
nr:MAG TPA: hypothetical protein [Caudoviricetes sp.]